jgi:hypothetical protein
MFPRYLDFKIFGWTHFKKGSNDSGRCLPAIQSIAGMHIVQFQSRDVSYQLNNGMEKCSCTGTIYWEYGWRNLSDRLQIRVLSEKWSAETVTCNIVVLTKTALRKSLPFYNKTSTKWWLVLSITVFHMINTGICRQYGRQKGIVTRGSV